MTTTVDFANNPITGSEKQIGWGDQIRLRKLIEMDEYVTLMVRDINDHADWSDAKKQAASALWRRSVASVVSGRRSAAWWIEERYTPSTLIVDDARRALVAAMTADEKAALKAL